MRTEFTPSEGYGLSVSTWIEHRLKKNNILEARWDNNPDKKLSLLAKKAYVR